MRKRVIRKIGNSYYVKLEQADIKDWEVKEGQEVCVSPLEENNDTAVS